MRFDRLDILRNWSRTGREEHLHAAEQALYAFVCSGTGAIFVTVFLKKQEVDMLVLLAAGGAMALTVTEYAIRWFQMIIGKEKLASTRFLPVAFMALLWVSLALCKNAGLPVLACLCVLVAALFLLLDDLPAWIKRRWEELGPDISICSAKRLSVMIPMVCTAIQSVIFGGCTVLAVEGDWLALIPYVPLFGYMIFWRKTLFSPREVCEPGNITFLTALCAVFFVYYCGYFVTKPGWLFWMGNPLCQALDLIAFAAIFGITVSLPALLDLLFLQKRLAPDADYGEKSRVLSVIVCVMTGIAYLAWVWLDFSYMYLLIFTITRAYWVHMASIERRKDYKDAWFWSILPLVTTAGLLCSELMGVWKSFHEIPAVLQNGNWFIEITAQAVMTAIINRENLMGKVGNELPFSDRIREKIRNAKMQEFYMVSLAIISAVLALLTWLGIGKAERLHYALLVALLDGAAILIMTMISFLADLTIRNQDTPRKAGKRGSLEA